MNPLKTFALPFALPFVLTLLTQSPGAFAAEGLAHGIKRRAPQGITTRLYTCVDKADSSPTAIAACLSAEKTAQDNRLNTAYTTLLGKLKGKAKEDLAASEQAWQDFHSKTGALEATLYGKEAANDLQRLENETFRLSERANTLDRYLAAVQDQ